MEPWVPQRSVHPPWTLPEHYTLTLCPGALAARDTYTQSPEKVAMKTLSGNTQQGLNAQFQQRSAEAPSCSWLSPSGSFNQVVPAL